MAQVCVSIDKFDTQLQSVVLRVNRIRLVCFDFQSVISRNVNSRGLKRINLFRIHA